MRHRLVNGSDLHLQNKFRGFLNIIGKRNDWLTGGETLAEDESEL